MDSLTAGVGMAAAANPAAVSAAAPAVAPAAVLALPPFASLVMCPVLAHHSPPPTYLHSDLPRLPSAPLHTADPGANNNMQLGDGSKNDSSRPVIVTGGISFTQVACGAGHVCGVAKDGSVFCWGSGYIGA